MSKVNSDSWILWRSQLWLSTHKTLNLMEIKLQIKANSEVRSEWHLDSEERYAIKEINLNADKVWRKQKAENRLKR